MHCQKCLANVVLEPSRPGALRCWLKPSDFSATQSTHHPGSEEGKWYPYVLTKKPVPGISEDEMWLSQPVTQKAIQSLCQDMGLELPAAGKNRWALGTPSKSNATIVLSPPLAIDDRRDSGTKNKVSHEIKHLRVEIFKRAIWQLLLLACWQCKLCLASWKAIPNKPYLWQLEALK